jgi:hypothetical protein
MGRMPYLLDSVRLTQVPTIRTSRSVTVGQPPPLGQESQHRSPARSDDIACVVWVLTAPLLILMAEAIWASGRPA